MATGLVGKWQLRSWGNGSAVNVRVKEKTNRSGYAREEAGKKFDVRVYFLKQARAKGRIS